MKIKIPFTENQLVNTMIAFAISLMFVATGLITYLAITEEPLMWIAVIVIGMMSFATLRMWLKMKFDINLFNLDFCLKGDDDC